MLGDEHGIGVRSGCFCAHPYVTHLLGLDRAAIRTWAAHAADGDHAGAPGMVRMSIGLSNDPRDIDHAIDALARIVAGDIAGEYRIDRHGDHHPTGRRRARVRT